MAISGFPERMNELDTENPEKALGTVENYIHYMCERVEFSLSNFFRTIGSYGTSSAEHALLLAAHDNAIHAMDSQITALTGRADELGRQMAALQAAVTMLSGAVTALQAAAADLDARVTVLEQARTGSEGTDGQKEY